MKLKSIFMFFSIVGPILFLILLSPTAVGLGGTFDTPIKCLEAWLTFTGFFEAFLLMLYFNKETQDWIKRGW